ncbi:Mu transposase C-terminal domain-containing protein [Kitasatospora sp. NPDC087861]|uniref:Mu transposase C-terminal domain-containing protein n=1 Tax=Kitasatospora sp. NPDC087861 TaxID=3364070 RepID=UPI00382B143C
MARLMDLDSRGELTTTHVRLVASSLGVTVRAVWYWIAAARKEGRFSPRLRARLTVTPEIRHLLAFWGGNVSAVHRELLARAADDPDAGPVLSLSALHRAVVRDLSVGERAGLRGGEAARRAHDVFGKRPATWRNACWEGDHKHAPVQVDVEGELACPWITWFIDCKTKYVPGLAVTPHAPSRDAVLAALRTSITRTEPFGPAGGLPALVRVDRGKEFLCTTVTAALGAFAVPVHDLPAYSPHLKGTIEALNDAVEEMFLVSLPRYTHRQKLTGGRLADADAPPLTFAAFVALLLDWVRWWNTEHHPAGLDGLTPTEAWNADPTPLHDVPAEHLAFFALEDDGRIRTITTNGISWRSRPYIAPWMVGHTGTKIRLRHLPHHDREIEVFDASTGRHLGTAHLADQASREQVRALKAARTAAARRLRADLKAAEKLRRQRFAAATTAAPPEPLDTLTAAEAATELEATDSRDLRALALPGLIPHTPLPDGWVLPQPAAATRRKPSGQRPSQPAETDPPQ